MPQHASAYPFVSADVQVAWKCNLDYSIVVLAHQGTARVHFEDAAIELLPGQALWIPQRMAHMVEHAAGSLALAILVPARHSRSNAALQRIEIPPGHAGWMFHLMLLTLSPLHRGQLPMARVVEHLERFTVQRHSAPLPGLPAARHPALARARRGLRPGQHDAPSLAGLAASAGVSERTLRRQIAAEYGIGFREFRRRATAPESLAAIAEHWQPVPALTTRWMSFPQHRYALWAYQGRGSISVADPRNGEQQVHTQRLEAGELLIIPDGYSVRLDIDSGALFFPLSMPLRPAERLAGLRLPLRLPRELEPVLLRHAIAHITALRPLHYDRRKAFELLEDIAGYPGLRWPDSPGLAAIARRLLVDASAHAGFAQLAAEHGMSLRSLQRAWREATGSTLSAWSLAHRMRRAEGMLAAGLPLPSVARWAGYAHVPNFSRAFAASRGRRPGSVHRSGSSGQLNIF